MKSFIERWEEHPNSPYVFDVNTTLILPTLDNKNNMSGFSSRGCSPSPCESLSSNAEIFQNGISAVNEVSTEMDNSSKSETKVKSQNERFERPNSSASLDNPNKTNQEYLQSFDRRHSDSNYVINKTSGLEKINLAEEIKKLSERLLVLSSINDELKELNKRIDDNKKPKTPSLDTKGQTKRSEVMKNMKNASFNSSTKTETITSSSDSKSVLIHSKSLLSEEATSSRITRQSVVSDLTERLKSLDELPSVFKTVGCESNRSDKTASLASRLQRTSVSSSSSGSTSPCTFNSVPWPITNRRTKFRVTQLSRDVPIGSPDSHQTIFLEEAANTTKDCLLQLLDKYNGKESRTCNIRRHQSIAVGKGITDNIEYHSMNSINAFFKRNVFQQSGNTVRKIKARIESKH